MSANDRIAARRFIAQFVTDRGRTSSSANIRQGGGIGGYKRSSDLTQDADFGLHEIFPMEEAALFRERLQKWSPTRKGLRPLRSKATAEDGSTNNQQPT